MAGLSDFMFDTDTIEFYFATRLEKTHRGGSHST